MAILSPFLIVLVLALVAVFAGLVVLQTVLSKADGRLPGIVLPAVSFLAALCFSIPNFASSFHVSFSPGAFGASLLILALYNVPTIVFALLYVWQRRKLEAARQLNKMNVQDL